MENKISDLALVRNYRNGGRWETFIAPNGGTQAAQEAVQLVALARIAPESLQLI